MKIAQICPYDYNSGSGVKSHILDLTEELKRHDHEVKVIFPGAENISEEDGIVRVGESYKMGVNRTNINITGLSFKDLRELRNFLDEENFDVIHYHEIWVPFLPLNILHLSHTANVVTFHGTPPDSFSARIIESTLMPFYSSLTFDYIDKVITVSKAPLNYLRKIYDGPIEIIPNGIDLKKFHTGHKKLEKYVDDKINILFLGRMDKRKGLMYLIKAYKILKEKHPNTRLLIAGDGEQRAEMESFVSLHDLKDVEVLGFIDEKIKPNVFATCDIFCSPAVEGESFGIVLLEAMAEGKPVVAYANAGYKEVLTGIGADLLVEPKDVEGLADKLSKLIESKEMRDEYANWGLKCAQEYKWSNIYDQIIEVYKAAIIDKEKREESTMRNLIGL